MIELAEDKLLHVIGRERLKLARPGDAGVDIGVDRELELVLVETAMFQVKTTFGAETQAREILKWTRKTGQVA